MGTQRLKATVRVQILLIGLFILVLNACGSGGDNTSSDQDSNIFTGIRFQLQFENKTYQETFALSGQSQVPPDICDDYLIQDILVEVYRASNDTVQASAERNCGTHGMTIYNVPANVSLNLICTAFVRQHACWHGQVNGIVVDAGQTLNIGTITMDYICDDRTPPEIEASFPGNSPDANINATIAVRFNEPLAPSSVSDQTIILTQDSTTLAGDVSYDPATYTISFTPQQDLQEGKTYVYSLTGTQENHVSDTAGIALIGSYSWQFTTGIVVNESPTALIDTPADGSTYETGTMIQFSGSGSDFEDGSLGDDSLIWFSDLDNRIGTGSNLATDQLSVGTHIITLSAVDSQSATGTDSISITITIPPPTNLHPFFWK